MVPLSDAARDRLLHANSFILLSLDPLKRSTGLRDEPGFFHGFKVLGKAEIFDREMRERLVVAIYQSSNKAKYNDEYSACFEPEHAIRIREGGSTLDLVICLHCGQGYFYGDAVADGCRFDSSSAKADLKIFDDALDELSIPRRGSPNR